MHCYYIRRTVFAIRHGKQVLQNHFHQLDIIQIHTGDVFTQTFTCCV